MHTRTYDVFKRKSPEIRFTVKRISPFCFLLLYIYNKKAVQKNGNSQKWSTEVKKIYFSTRIADESEEGETPRRGEIPAPWCCDLTSVFGEQRSVPCPMRQLCFACVFLPPDWKLALSFLLFSQDCPLARYMSP